MKIKLTFFKMAIPALMSLCSSAVAQPDNDDPCGATLVTVNSGFYCPDPENYSGLGATNTATSLIGLPICSTPNADIWFKFVATATQQRITKQTISGTANIGMAVYSSTAGSCAAISEMICSTSGKFINLTSCEVGSTYYVRVWNASTTSSGYNVDLCIAAPAPVPLNDECANAVPLDNAIIHGIATDSATQSKLPNNCGWGFSSDAFDVWYKFTAVSAGIVTVTADRGTDQPLLNLELFNSCADANPIACDDETFEDPYDISVTSTAGNTYYFRVYGNNYGSGNSKGYYTIQASGTPLPVTSSLLAVTVDNDGYPSLNWYTESERNNYGFNIERSVDGKDFETVNFVAAKAKSGNSSERISYQFTDNAVLLSPVFYRLRQQDIDGAVSFSNIVSAQPRLLSNMQIYPNPADKYISTIGLPESSFIKIFNTNGRVVKEIESNHRIAVIPIEDLEAGIYILHTITTSGTLSTARFVKK